jgi:APA family basic amino acid/polyamine antiporter
MSDDPRPPEPEPPAQGAAVRSRRPHRRGSARRDPEAAAHPGFESVLVVLDGHVYPPGVMATALKFAAPRRHGIHVLVPITVPASHAVDDPLPAEERGAEALIEQARLQGGRRVTGHWAKVRAGQAGRAIVDEARALRARAIVLPLPRRASGTLLGRTIETVLAERPCRVIIQSEPAPLVRGAR